jgi:hypothetical protein
MDTDKDQAGFLIRVQPWPIVSLPGPEERLNASVRLRIPHLVHRSCTYCASLQAASVGPQAANYAMDLGVLPFPRVTGWRRAAKARCPITGRAGRTDFLMQKEK